MRVVSAVAVLLTASVLVSAATSRGTGANAEITFTCPHALCVVDPDGSRRSVLLTAWYDSYGDPGWSRDGTSLAFFVGYSDTHKIAVFRVATRDRVELPRSRDAESFDPTWSPDGTRIAVTEITGRGVVYGVQDSTIEILSLATASHAAPARYARVTKPRAGRIDTEPAWSPDGRTIAFVRQTRRTPPTIFLIGADGRGERRLTLGRSPSWSPDGVRLAFARDRVVYVQVVGGGGPRRILRGVRHPLVRWSPDGTKILVASGRNAWVTGADGRHRVRVLHEAGDIEGVAWRPG